MTTLLAAVRLEMTAGQQRERSTPVKLRPTPPASVLMRKAKTLSSLLNSSQSGRPFQRSAKDGAKQVQRALVSRRHAIQSSEGVRIF